MDNYEEYKKYYNDVVTKFPGDKRLEKFFDYMLRRKPNMTLYEFSCLEDKIILDEE